MARLKGVKNKVKGEYTASLIMFGRSTSATGGTISTAIAGIKPISARGKGVLVVEKGTERQEKLLPPVMVSRLFGPASSIAKEIALKQASQRFSL